MTAPSDPQPDRPAAPAELHWGISYLREDIQDIRQDIKDVRQESRDEMRQTNVRMDSRFDEVNERMDSRFGEVNKRLDSRFTMIMTMMIALTGVLLAAIKL